MDQNQEIIAMLKRIEEKLGVMEEELTSLREDFEDAFFEDEENQEDGEGNK